MVLNNLSRASSSSRPWLLRPLSQVQRRGKSSTVLSAQVTDSQAPQGLKSYDDIPGPRELPVFGSFFKVLGASAKSGFHTYIQDLHEQFGDIVRFSILGQKNVFVRQPDVIRNIFLKNQYAPLRHAADPQVMSLKRLGLPLGAAFQLNTMGDVDADYWRKHRKFLAKLLTPAIVASYVPRVGKIGLRLAETLHASEQKYLSVSELKMLTQCYVCEAITAAVLGKNMGLLGKKNPLHNVDHEIQTFFDASADVFGVASSMMFSEVPWWKVMETKSRKRLDSAFLTLFVTTGRWVRGTIKNGTTDPEYANDGAQNLIQIMLEEEATSGHAYTEDDLVTIASTAIAAGVDTTSTAVQWMMILMAQNPDVQERLASRLREVVGPHSIRTPITAQHVADANLYGFVEELLRIEPVLVANTRAFQEDVVIMNYKIPKMTTIGLTSWLNAKDPRFFQKPEVFDETRLQRKECPFGVKTFGAGARQCPGERFARLEMAVALGTLIHQFKIEASQPAVKVESKIAMFLTPDPTTDVTWRFVPRA